MTVKIVSLEAENVKHLRVVHIKPDGSLVVVGGDNAQGKTCVLDSIEYALSGAGSIPEKPIRTGQKKARVVLDLGEIVVTRTFTTKGTNLTVKSKEGVTFASPQAMLDKLVGELTFDPLEFSKMDTKRQAEVLKKLVGLDFDAMNAKHKSLFDDRTLVNRRGKELKAVVDKMTEHDGMPDDEVSIKEIGGRYAAALAENQKIDRSSEALKRDQDELLLLEEKVAILKKRVAQTRKSLSGVKKVDATSIQAQMTEAENTNRKVRENKAYAQSAKELELLRAQSGSIGTQMADIVEKKSDILAKAKFPIVGLAIDEDGVMFKDIPFAQCSSAQRIKISVAIGLAMNPKLRVLLIREGSFLDSTSLGIVAKMAEKADAQVWVERVSKGSECTVIMEDGSIMERRTSNV